MIKKILIVEGNLRDENENFSKVGIKTHTESLKESLSYYPDKFEFDVVNPSSDHNLNKYSRKLEKYDGLIWGGSSLNIYNDTDEIRRQIEFMKECQKKVRKILAICWGMQVAVVAAGGEVKKSSKGCHIGIAESIEINTEGKTHPLYFGKNSKFNSPAFNFDEVVKLPKNSKLLASNYINSVQSITFTKDNCQVWGLQYHPEITYEKMIQLIEFRKDRLINFRKAFKNETEIENHIDFIKAEISKSSKDQRMLELKNWVENLNGN